MSCKLPKFSFVAIFSVLSVIILLSVFAPGSHSFYKNNIVHASSATTSVSANGSSNTSLSPFSNSSIEASSGSNSLEYSARFFCGTIVGEEGPLRPGRYDSDINIFNRQSFPISFFWKAVAASQEEEQSDSNFRIRSLEPGGSISLSCKDIQASIPAYANDTGEKFFEGIMTINVDLDSSVIGSISSDRKSVLG